MPPNVCSPSSPFIRSLISPFTIASSVSARSIVGLKKAAPKLREIHLYNNRRVCLSCRLSICENLIALQISSLAELKGITTLHLDIHIDSRAEADIPNDIASALATPPPVVEDAKRYLSESKSDSPKFLKVIYKVHDFELEERWKDVYHRPQRWKVASVQDFEL